ncbi:MAG: diguanylate cyclase [Atopobiaceae bacterium]|nr:diguanylate cyclase [Atopobiaceae bacterium]
MRGHKLSFTTRYVLVLGILLLAANIVMGMVILNQSKAAMRELINKNMLDVVESAARSLDGDVLGSLTAEDEDSPAWQDIEKRLLVFQDSVDIHYIYTVKPVDEDSFTFIVDPDPVDPGAFGEEIVTTPAVKQAAKGIPAVDENPVADRWGNLYSAFCPVYDSKGTIAGIVGVDFDAQWFDERVVGHTLSIAAVTSLSVLAGGVLVTIMTKNVRKKFQQLDAGLSELSGHIDHLVNEMSAYAGFEAPASERDPHSFEEDSDELGILSDKIAAMQNEMTTYLDYLHAQAYTDALTKVGSVAAYQQAIEDIDTKIASDNADFWVAVFDINGLKELNDTYGHETGNLYIRTAAKMLAEGLEETQAYRIGGDEFAIIAEGYDQTRMDVGLQHITESLAAFNASDKPCPAILALSSGVAQYTATTDSSFKDVFSRADEAMYEDKREYYRTVGDRRGHRRHS